MFEVILNETNSTYELLEIILAVLFRNFQIHLTQKDVVKTNDTGHTIKTIPNKFKSSFNLSFSLNRPK